MFIGYDLIFFLLLWSMSAAENYNIGYDMKFYYMMLLKNSKRSAGRLSELRQIIYRATQ